MNKMMKPELEVVRFGAEDVIATSMAVAGCAVDWTHGDNVLHHDGGGFYAVALNENTEFVYGPYLNTEDVDNLEYPTVTNNGGSNSASDAISAWNGSQYSTAIGAYAYQNGAWSWVGCTAHPHTN